MTVLIKDEGFQSDDLCDVAFDLWADITTDTRFLDMALGTDPEPVVPYFPQLEAIGIPFISFHDGRGFSLAIRLRSLGYKGRLRAYGHLISDQYSHARRCGFDEILIDQALSERQPAWLWTDLPNAQQRSYQNRLLRTG